MDEGSEQKENPGGHEDLVNDGSAARTRPTSIEEIMLRRKRKETLINVNEETVVASQLQGNDLVEKASDYHESEKGHARSKKVRHEERVKDHSSNKEEAISDTREENLEKPIKEDPVGAVHLLANELVEKVSDCHASGKGHDRPKKWRREERVKENSNKKEDAVSSSREEKLKKEVPAGVAQLLDNNLVQKDSDYHESDRSKNLRHEERVKESSSIKEPTKEDLEGAAQLLGNDPVKRVSDYHVSEKGHDRSKKVRCEERSKESSSKKEDAISNSREEKPVKKDPVVSDYHEPKKGYDRSKKVRREEHFMENSRNKEDAISSSKEKKLIKEDLEGMAQLLGNDLVERVSDYHESGKGYDRSEKSRREEHAKDSSRKKEEAVCSSREEAADKQKREEERTHRKRKAEGEGSRAERDLVEEHVKDRRRKKEETYSNSREEKLDGKTKKKDLAAYRKESVEGDYCVTEIKTTKDRDGFGVDTRIKATGESHAAKTTEKQSHPQGTGQEERSSGLENVHSSRKRLRSLVVADIPRNEDSLQPDDGNRQKNQNGDHKNNRDRNMSKRHDPGKVHSVQDSERWEKREQSKLHQSDLREKRRRSRSRGHGQDRQKRSSPLPRDEKTTSHRKRNHEEHLENPAEKPTRRKRDHEEHSENTAEKPTSRRKRDHEDRSENSLKDNSRKHQFKDNENKVASTVNNKSRRYSASNSELGGYSPRKRREETSAKPTSPPSLSSEKKCGKWDLPRTVTADISSGSLSSGPQAAIQTAYPTISEVSLTHLKPLMDGPSRMPLARQTTSVDSVQLTESTRRMRRLYAENVPDSASEKSLIECLNGYMLSSGSNQIKGSEPCISCMINKEKCQALVEFLTPQDASAALSLDGCSFEGSSLKLRRPKDYVETTSGELEKKEPATNALSDNVEDSSNKIFIGGFPKTISSEMLMEIVSVFGPLKSYRFVNNNDLNQRSAFLEYADGSITPKACAGLNGMKLGGSVITAVCAFLDASSVTVNENRPFYGIPEHAKPLLGKPKHILKLKNVVDPEDLPSLSETEMKEILEDVRLECARFGVIKSINIVEQQSRDIAGSETDASVNPVLTHSKDVNVSIIEEKDEGSKKADYTADSVDPEEVVRPGSSTGEDKLCEPCSDTGAETNSQADEDHDTREHDLSEKIDGENTQDKQGNHPQEVGIVRAVKTRWDTGERIEEEQDPEDVFEPGCIFIEYARPEATRDAAHLLHGRLYENRVVKVDYVSKELYQIRFPSG